MIWFGCLISLNTQQPYLVAYAHASRLLAWLAVDPSQSVNLQIEWTTDESSRVSRVARTIPSIRLGDLSDATCIKFVYPGSQSVTCRTQQPHHR